MLGRRPPAVFRADDEDDEIDLFESEHLPTLSRRPPSAHSGDDSPIHISLYSRSLDRGSSELSGSNVGRRMLELMGWQAGTGLGLHRSGRIDPIPISDKRGGDLTGIGKSSMDARFIEVTTSQRKEMLSEAIMKESEEERVKRETDAACQSTIQASTLAALQAYRCDLCEKQYNLPSEYEGHLKSYDHHHKKRMKEMLVIQKGNSANRAATEKRKEKERKREEKELKRLADAAGVSLAAGEAKEDGMGIESTRSEGGSGWSATTTKSSSAGWKAVSSAAPPAHTTGTPVAAATTSGWKTVSNPTSSSSPSPGGFRPITATTTRPSSFGFRPIASAAATPPTNWSGSTSIPSSGSSKRLGGWKKLSDEPPSQSTRPVPASTAPSKGFVSGGFVTLETSSSPAHFGSQRPPPPPPGPPPPPPPPIDLPPPPPLPMS